MLTINNLTFSYGTTGFRLHIPDLSVENREKLAIVGPSGSGKTTLLNLVAGLICPQGGSIKIAAQEVTELSDAKRRQLRATQIGFVFQDFALLDYLSARQNIYYPYRITPATRISTAAAPSITSAL